MVKPSSTIVFLFSGLLVIAVTAVFGCNTMPPFESLLPQELPAALAYVYEHPDAFTQGRDDGLADVTAGKVVDDLAGLSGCWGSYIEDIASEDDMPVRVDDYSALVFDRAAGEFTWWTLEDFGGHFPMVISQTGRFSVVGDDRIQLVMVGVGNYNPLTGEFEEMWSEEEVAMECLATLSNGRLKLLMLDAPGYDAPDTSEADYSFVFVRFDCPG